jgi:hypothetical protein
MSKKLALTAIFATALTLAVPATSAFALGGGHISGGFAGPMGGVGGHIGGGFASGPVAVGGGHISGGFAGGPVGGGHIGGMAGPEAFGSARGLYGHSVHAGLHVRQGRRFIRRGPGDYNNPCWDWQSGSYRWACHYPY